MKGLGRVKLGVLLLSCLMATGATRASVCVEQIATGLQTHGGSIDFSFYSQLAGNFESTLPAASILGRGARHACNGQKCEATAPVSPLPLSAYPYSPNKGASYEAAPFSYLSWAPKDQRVFSRVAARFASLLEVQASGPLYIARMEVQQAATLKLSSGDYWVKNLDLAPFSRIERVGDGPVRLFVDGNIHIPRGASLNAGGNPQDLLVHTSGSLQSKSSHKSRALVYARRAVELAPLSHWDGRILAADIRLPFAARVRFGPGDMSPLWQDLCADNADLDNDGLPDGLDHDRDGDGVLNASELVAGSNPDDNQDLPDSETPVVTAVEFNQCTAPFGAGLQSHSASGSLAFEYNARLLDAPSSALPAVNVESRFFSSLPSCGDEFCYASGSPSPLFPTLDFPENNGTETLTLRPRQSLTVNVEQATHYKRLVLKPKSALHLSATAQINLGKV
ncbi:MAG: hypothetical protein ACKVLK_16805, partial [Spongiibacter sp.]